MDDINNDNIFDFHIPNDDKIIINQKSSRRGDKYKNNEKNIEYLDKIKNLSTKYINKN